MKTTSLGLKKPEGADPVDIQDFNENADKIDTELLKRPEKTGAASDMTNTFSQAGSLANLTSGEAQKVSFGKVMKAIADYISHKATAGTTGVLGHVKLSDTYASTVSGGAAANGMGASQKALSDAYNALNTNFKGATASTAGAGGLVPAPAAGKQGQYLRADGTWQTPPNTTYNVATGSANGLMSSADKSKLDGVATNANNYSHPSTAGNKHIPSGGSSGQILRWSADGTAAWGTDSNTTYSPATTSANGLMSAADKTKLNGVATGANNYTHPNSGTTAGTFKSVTVNSQGHVTAGTNPTTLSGYGITDAAPKNHASSNTTYGIGTSNTYGHVILSDAYQYVVTYGNADCGMGASQMALADAYSELKYNSADKNIYGDKAVSLGRKSGSTVGDKSIAFGDDVTASGRRSQAFGYGCTAIGDGSHAEGYHTLADGDKGGFNQAAAHAEGSLTKAIHHFAHAEGNNTTASGISAHAEGGETEASGRASHAEGTRTIASNDSSHAEGNNTTASGVSAHAEGGNTAASNYASHAGGKYNAAMTTGAATNSNAGTAFVVGNGTSASARSNAFSIMYTGVVKAKSTITGSTTADYAEFFEWSDGNPTYEDRIGHFVTLDGDKIRTANEGDDYILGIVSGEPFVLGNSDCDTWNGMFLRDEFNRTRYERAPKTERDEETGEEVEIKDEDGSPVYYGIRPVLNPDYNPNEPYVPRSDRPEWSPIGMLGVLSVYDDGTCLVNGYCRCGNSGIATKADTGYRVIQRVAGHIVRVVFR